MSLEGKTALVTGSTGDIGEAFARAFAEAGCNVVFNGFGAQAEIDTLRGALERTGAQVLYHPADVGKPDPIAEMIAAAQSSFGLATLVRMKELAGRAKDQEDIRQLRLMLRKPDDVE